MVKARTLQITWHAKEGRKNDPILSLDYHPTLPYLATAGADCEIKIWKFNESEFVAGRPQGNLGAEPCMQYKFTLLGHMKSVNSVRWSPNGESLASVGDDGTCIVWHPPFGLTWATIEFERQLQRVIMRGHSDDVYDVAWSPDSLRIVSCSIDNTCIVWDVVRGKSLATLDAHNHFVKGVCWDPAGKYIVSESSDRTTRIYTENYSLISAAMRGPKFLRRQQQAKLASGRSGSLYTCSKTIKIGVIETEEKVDNSASINLFKYHLFEDENVPSFFRRPCFSPDGTILLTPTGSFRESANSPSIPTTYAFARDHFNLPICHYPGTKYSRSSICVKASPILYNLREQNGIAVSNNVYTLPYRMVFAIATLNSVIVYDTQSEYPIAAISNMHLEKLTDICWSNNGKSILLSSVDGYVSVIHFGNELGDALPSDDAAYPSFMKAKNFAPVFPPPKPKRERAPKSEQLTTQSAEGSDQKKARRRVSLLEASPVLPNNAAGSTVPPTSATDAIGTPVKLPTEPDTLAVAQEPVPHVVMVEQHSESVSTTPVFGSKLKSVLSRFEKKA